MLQTNNRNIFDKLSLIQLRIHDSIANNVSMIHRISIKKCRDAQINRVKSIVQVSALQTYIMLIFIRNKKGSFAKNNGIVNLILVTNISCIIPNQSVKSDTFKLVIATLVDSKYISNRCTQTIFSKYVWRFVNLQRSQGLI